jgi:hypothetical protein
VILAEPGEDKRGFYAIQRTWWEGFLAGKIVEDIQLKPKNVTGGRAILRILAANSSQLTTPDAAISSSANGSSRYISPAFSKVLRTPSLCNHFEIDSA